MAVKRKNFTNAPSGSINGLQRAQIGVGYPFLFTVSYCLVRAYQASAQSIEHGGAVVAYQASAQSIEHGGASVPYQASAQSIEHGGASVPYQNSAQSIEHCLQN